MSNTDHIGPPDMNLESRASPVPVLGVPVDPELHYASQQGQLKGLWMQEEHQTTNQYLLSAFSYGFSSYCKAIFMDC